MAPRKTTSSRARLTTAWLALITTFLLTLTTATTARADLAPSRPVVSLDELQVALCSRERAGDSCGQGPSGEPLVCAEAIATGGKQLLCLRAAVPGTDASATPTGPHTEWRRDPAYTPLDADPEVARARTTYFGISVASAIVGIAALVAVGLRRRQKWLLPAGAIALAGAIGLFVWGQLQYGRTVRAYEAREAGRAVPTEYVVYPVTAAPDPTQQWAANNAFHEHLLKLATEKHRLP